MFRVLRSQVTKSFGAATALKAARVEFVVSVPDIVISDGLLWPVSRDPEVCDAFRTALRAIPRADAPPSSAA